MLPTDNTKNYQHKKEQYEDNYKKIALTTIVGYSIGIATPIIAGNNEKREKKPWPTWIKVSAAATLAVGSICLWYWLDRRLQGTLAISMNSAKKQFVEHLTYHAITNNDGTPRMIRGATSYKIAPEREIFNNSLASLKILVCDVKTDLFLYQIANKLCALATALGLYRVIPSKQKKGAEPDDTKKV